ncbi:MAG TPA: hypothetical protein VEY93_09285 [Longimicrobium sp.]|nr:hypothetical protein [Longimicrobium sp.]
MGNREPDLENVNRRDFLLASLSAALGSLALVGCDSAPRGLVAATVSPFPYRAPGDQAINLVGSTVQPHEILASLPQGTTTDWKRLEGSALIQLRDDGWVEGEIRVLEGRLPTLPRFSARAAAHMNAASREIKGSVGTYFYRLSAESGYIGGCIRKHNVPHLGLLLKDKITGRQIVNLHLCSWVENGRRCFGVYNSAGNGWCQKVCAPTRKQMQDILTAALIAAGMVAIVAAVVSGSIIPLAAPALLL